MAKQTKVPPIPTRETHFDRGGLLTFKIKEGCAYCPDIPGFVGGDWVNARFRTKEGETAIVRLDGGQLVIETLEYGEEYLGFKRKEIVRINVCD